MYIVALSNLGFNPPFGVHMHFKALRKTLALSVLATASLAVQAADIDHEIPDYERTSGVSGNLSSVGSDTLANLMTCLLYTSPSPRD